MIVKIYNATSNTEAFRFNLVDELNRAEKYTVIETDNKNVRYLISGAYLEGIANINASKFSLSVPVLLLVKDSKLISIEKSVLILESASSDRIIINLSGDEYSVDKSSFIGNVKMIIAVLNSSQLNYLPYLKDEEASALFVENTTF